MPRRSGGSSDRLSLGEERLYTKTHKARDTTQHVIATINYTRALMSLEAAEEVAGRSGAAVGRL